MSNLPFLYLSDADVRRLITPADAVECAEHALRRQAESRVTWSEPRLLTVSPPGATLKYAAKACVLDEDYAGFRATMVDRAVRAADIGSDDTPRQLVLLCDARTGRFLAVIDEEWQHAVRTVAAAAVAVRHCAVSGPQVVALIGAGRVAKPALGALLAVGEVAEIRIASRRPETRAALALEFGPLARPAADVGEAVRDATAVLTATTTTEPIVRADWLRPGAFVYAMGDGQELETEVYERADQVMADDWLQCQFRLDIKRLVADHVIDPTAVTSLWEIVGKLKPGRRSPDELVVMRSQGLATQDVAIAVRTYESALKTGTGIRLGG